VHLQLTNLFGVILLAFAVPFVLGFFPTVRVPSAAVELLIGILIGPALLGWVEPGLVVSTMSSLGVAFLLFLAGMELDLRQLRGAPLRLGALGFLASLAVTRRPLYLGRRLIRRGRNHRPVGRVLRRAWD
jgi:Kef-type K+ transport system membrane component KefB